MATGFLKIPKTLLSEGEYTELDPVAVVLYGLLADRQGLSVKNGWRDEEGRAYIFFPREDLAKILRVSERTIRSKMTLLKKAGLIRETRQGAQKANRIYVNMPFTSMTGKDCRSEKPSSCMTGKNDRSLTKRPEIIAAK